ncbi:hypothetical protein MTBSS4_170015 [Magnetospirillum sp. SS-4]|nr:hypothetical protein MTBSS4_170015 [Magnetospirillum sp. SS-4]
MVQHVARRIAFGGDGQADADQVAVLVAVDQFALPAAGLAEGRPQLLVEGPVLQARTQKFRRLADGFGGIEAGNGGEGRIDDDDAVVGVGGEHAFEGMIDNGLIKRQLAYAIGKAFNLPAEVRNGTFGHIPSRRNLHCPFSMKPYGGACKRRGAHARDARKNSDAGITS